MYDDIEICGKPLSYYALEAPLEEVTKVREAWEEIKQNPLIDATKIYDTKTMKINELTEENIRLKNKLNEIHNLLEEE